MRKTVPPLTPFPRVKSTGAGGAVGRALGSEAEARMVGDGRAADDRTDAVAAVLVAPSWLTLFDSQPPSYRTAASNTQAAAPRPTAMRIAVSGFRAAVGG